MNQHSRLAGFSLLEVMVALAILTVGMTSLLQVQARSAQLALDAKDLSIATMLARAKLYDCQHDLLQKGFAVGDYESEGNFDDEGQPKFYWECHGYKPDMPTGDGIGDMSSATGMLGGAGGGADGAPNPAMDASMGMIAPVLQQMASVLGDSIRELTVIVRWGEGDARQELRVVTHVIDKQPVNRVATMIQQQTRALGAALGQPAGDTPATPGAPGTPGRTGSTPLSPIPGVPGSGGFR